MYVKHDHPEPCDTCGEQLMLAVLCDKTEINGEKVVQQYVCPVCYMFSAYIVENEFGNERIIYATLKNRGDLFFWT